MLFIKAALKCTLDLMSYYILNLAAVLKATEILYKKIILEECNVLPLSLGHLPNTKSQDTVCWLIPLLPLFPLYPFPQTTEIPLKVICHVTSTPTDIAVLLKILPWLFLALKIQLIQTSCRSRGGLCYFLTSPESLFARDPIGQCALVTSDLEQHLEQTRSSFLSRTLLSPLRVLAHPQSSSFYLNVPYFSEAFSNKLI